MAVSLQGTEFTGLTGCLGRCFAVESVVCHLEQNSIIDLLMQAGIAPLTSLRLKKTHSSRGPGPTFLPLPCFSLEEIYVVQLIYCR